MKNFLTFGRQNGTVLVALKRDSKDILYNFSGFEYGISYYIKKYDKSKQKQKLTNDKTWGILSIPRNPDDCSY